MGFNICLWCTAITLSSCSDAICNCDGNNCIWIRLNTILSIIIIFSEWHRPELILITETIWLKKNLKYGLILHRNSPQPFHFSFFYRMINDNNNRFWLNARTRKKKKKFLLFNRPKNFFLFYREKFDFFLFFDEIICSVVELLTMGCRQRDTILNKMKRKTCKHLQWFLLFWFHSPEFCC